MEATEPAVEWDRAHLASRQERGRVERKAGAEGPRRAADESGRAVRRAGAEAMSVKQLQAFSTAPPLWEVEALGQESWWVPSPPCSARPHEDGLASPWMSRLLSWGEHTVRDSDNPGLVRATLQANGQFTRKRQDSLQTVPGRLVHPCSKAHPALSSKSLFSGVFRYWPEGCLWAGCAAVAGTPRRRRPTPVLKGK